MLTKRNSGAHRPYLVRLLQAGHWCPPPPPAKLHQHRDQRKPTSLALTWQESSLQHPLPSGSHELGNNIDSFHRFFCSSRSLPSLRHGIGAVPASSSLPVKSNGRRDSGIYSSKPFLYRVRVLPNSLGANDCLPWSETNRRIGHLRSHLVSSSPFNEDHLNHLSFYSWDSGFYSHHYLIFYKLGSRRPPPSTTSSQLPQLSFRPLEPPPLISTSP